MLVALLAVAATAGGAPAAIGSPHHAAKRPNAYPAPKLPAATYQTVSRNIAIRMDDGVHLGATVTFPSRDGKVPAPGRFPVVVSMTPYGRTGPVCGCGNPPLFAARGIIAVAVDTRGTGGSEGNLKANYFSPREARDGYEIIEYFGTRKYSTGKVGMTGGSYVGITQYLTAEQQPPHLAAIVPQVAVGDLYRDAFTHDGIPNIFFDAQYIAVQGGPGLATPNGPDQLPLTISAKLGQIASRPIMFDYLARPNDGKFYRDRSAYYHARRIKVPVLVVDGWRDGFIRGAMEMYRALARRKGVDTSLFIDPCTHKGCAAPFDLADPQPNQDDEQALIFEYLSHYLRGTPMPPRPPARFYVQQRGGSANAQSWPPPRTRFLRFALANGRIAQHTPRRATTARYSTNPTAGLSMAFDYYGTVAISPYLPTDQRLEDGHGLTWRTGPARHSVTLAGPTQVHLVAASQATDTDWVIKLADVAPSGKETLVTQGYLRASHRKLLPARSTKGSPYHRHAHPTPIQPGRYYSYDIAVWPTAYRLAAGHRLQLRLTSIDVPTHAPASIKLARNGLGGTKVDVTPLLPTTNTVREGGRNPSWVLLPIYSGAF
jgi:predicted acyl esterase